MTPELATWLRRPKRPRVWEPGYYTWVLTHEPAQVKKWEEARRKADLPPLPPADVGERWHAAINAQYRSK
jgi:hypothetical protein